MTSTPREPLQFNEIAAEITESATALKDEVDTVFGLIDGREHLFRHAHFGYMMACMGQLDVMSLCMFGPDRKKGDQTRRMQRFMERHLDAHKVDEHRVAIQLMRHTLMHTGALRYVYDETNRVAYTWQIYFGDSSSSGRQHYTLTAEAHAYQDHLLDAAQGRSVDKIDALNVRLTLFADDVLRASDGWHSEMSSDEHLQAKCESIYPSVRFQVFNRVRTTRVQ